MNGTDKARHWYGEYAAVKAAVRLGIDFIDYYVARFGRMPRLHHIEAR